ncbi:MAG TPA: GGDEF domain-containing protein, partial [Ideonella sp.]|nr:GGDEF domain-containing protein [Ideonella sp.]
MSGLTRPAPLGVPSGPAPLAGSVAAQTAKAALRRLAQARLEPTPENYARAYYEELGAAQRPLLPPRSQMLFERMAAALLPDEAPRSVLVEAFAKGQTAAVERLLDAAAAQQPAQAQAVAALMRALVRGLERADRHWTLARKKESLRTVLDGTRGDTSRLLQRLSQLLASWEREGPAPSMAAELDAVPAAPNAAPAAAPAAAPEVSPAAAPEVAPAAAVFALVEALGGALRRALPADDEAARTAGHALGSALAEVTAGNAAAAEALPRHAAVAEQLLQRRLATQGQLHALCGELTGALTELAEDESWARGQCEAMRARLAECPTGRGLRSVRALLDHTRERQRELRAERERARDALKGLIHEMLQQVGELGTHTGRFTDNVARYAEVIDHADSLESLAGAVREMVA